MSNLHEIHIFTKKVYGMLIAYAVMFQKYTIYIKHTALLNKLRTRAED